MIFDCNTYYVVVLLIIIVYVGYVGNRTSALLIVMVSRVFL